jgi:AmmeMemoRadiSam system protein B
MRPPRFAGMFYEAAPTMLDKQLEWCFKSKNGPGELPATKKKGDEVLGAIVPHAGYIYSGPCAAWAYKAIAEAGMPDLFIILGPNHHGTGAGTTMETFDLPYGEIRVDQDFVRKLLEKGTIKINDQAHATEHSIEVQLPFLQFVFKKNLEKIKIVPIIVDHDVDLKKLAVDIKETILDTKKKVIIIAASDFTHYGRNYHYVPFSIDIKKNIYKLDGDAIELIKNMDAKGFLEYVDDKMATICGSLAIALLMLSVNSKKVLLEQYYTSGDLSDDYKNSVSYASIIFK